MNLSFTVQAQDNLNFILQNCKEKTTKQNKVNLLAKNVHLI